VWGITQISKPFFVTFEIVRDIPFTHIDAFSIRFLCSFLGTSNSNKYDLSIFLIFDTLATAST
jgi:hypothetical protein